MVHNSMGPLGGNEAHNHKGYVEGITWACAKFCSVNKKRSNRRLDFEHVFCFCGGFKLSCRV